MCASAPPTSTASINFATDIVGLQLAAREGKAAYFRSDKVAVRGDTRDHTLVYFEGDPADQTIGFDLLDPEALDAVGAELEKRRPPRASRHARRMRRAPRQGVHRLDRPDRQQHRDPSPGPITAARAISRRATPASRISAISASTPPTRRATTSSGPRFAMRASPTGSAMRRCCASTPRTTRSRCFPSNRAPASSTSTTRSRTSTT